MEKNYFKLSGFDEENLDLGFFRGVRMPKIRTPKIRMPRVKMPKVKIPKIRTPKISTKSFNKSIKNISKSFRGAGKSLNKLTSNLSNDISKLGQQAGNLGNEFGDILNNAGSSLNSAIQSGTDTFMDYLNAPIEFGEHLIHTGLDAVQDVTAGLFDAISGPSQSPEQEQQIGEEYPEESYDIPEESETVYNDPELGDYILDADGNPVFFDENSNALYYGY